MVFHTEISFQVCEQACGKKQHLKTTADTGLTCLCPCPSNKAGGQGAVGTGTQQGTSRDVQQGKRPQQVSPQAPSCPEHSKPLKLGPIPSSLCLLFCCSLFIPRLFSAEAESQLRLLKYWIRHMSFFLK